MPLDFLTLMAVMATNLFMISAALPLIMGRGVSRAARHVQASLLLQAVAWAAIIASSSLWDQALSTLSIACNAAAQWMLYRALEEWLGPRPLPRILLVLVIAVRNGGSDAYQQVHRVNPVAIDFKAGGNAERIQQDRRRMLLHRLFDNRLQIAPASIEALVGKHVTEYFRLLDVPSAEQERKRQEFTESWPYAPHLLRLLEEQVLIATDAQETRDMIRILANLYKSRGEAAPVLTAADFRLDDDASGIGLADDVACCVMGIGGGAAVRGAGRDRRRPPRRAAGRGLR